MIYIVACGGTKGDAPAPAAQLYTGAYFRRCLAYARARLECGDQLVILSAKWGLVHPAQIVAPYDVTIGDPDSVGPAEVARQATDLELTLQPVTVLGGRRYVDLVQAVWTVNSSEAVTAPLLGVGGIGRQLVWLRENTPQ